MSTRAPDVPRLPDADPDWFAPEDREELAALADLVATVLDNTRPGDIRILAADLEGELARAMRAQLRQLLTDCEGDSHEALHVLGIWWRAALAAEGTPSMKPIGFYLARSPADYGRRRTVWDSVARGWGGIPRELALVRPNGERRRDGGPPSAWLPVSETHQGIRDSARAAARAEEQSPPERRPYRQPRRPAAYTSEPVVPRSVDQVAAEGERFAAAMADRFQPAPDLSRLPVRVEELAPVARKLLDKRRPPGWTVQDLLDRIRAGDLVDLGARLSQLQRSAA